MAGETSGGLCNDAGARHACDETLVSVVPRS